MISKDNNKFYDSAKFAALVVLPALGALYFGLAQIWGLPNAEEVVGSITVVDTFLGVVLKLSSSAYNKSDAPYDGNMVVTQKPDGGLAYSLSLNGDPATLAERKSVNFKVETPLDA